MPTNPRSRIGQITICLYVYSKHACVADVVLRLFGWPLNFGAFEKRCPPPRLMCDVLYELGSSHREPQPKSTATPHVAAVYAKFCRCPPNVERKWNNETRGQCQAKQMRMPRRIMCPAIAARFGMEFQCAETEANL